MGFGGGGSGSFVLPNHDHTNVLADGGELEELVSLIDGITLKVWLDTAIAANPPTTQRMVQAVNFSTVSAVFVDVTGFTLTMPTRVGKALITANLDISNSTAGSLNAFQYVDNATVIGGIVRTNPDANVNPIPLVMTCDLAGQVVKIQCKRNAGTVYVQGNGADRNSAMVSLEI